MAMTTTLSAIILFTKSNIEELVEAEVDPEIADQFHHQHFSCLREAVTTSGGTEVKSVGDGLMVAFDAASSALACAIAMQQAVDAFNRTHTEAATFQIGISAGETTAEEGDYFGDPVVEAARLAAKAEPGQILTASWLRAMARRRAEFQFRDAGALELKGIPEPLESLELQWEPLAQESSEQMAVSERLPLAPRLLISPDIGRVLGRVEEEDLLIQAYKRVAGGEGREVILISGEPGAGKSTLAFDLARKSHELGATVLFGHCEEDVPVPYGPFAEALNHFVAHTTDDVLSAHVAADGMELATIVPALGRRLRQAPPLEALDPDVQRQALFSSISGLLSTIASTQPLIIVLDDLQWADSRTLQLLRHVIGTSHSMDLLLVLIYRDQMAAAHPLRQLLGFVRREQKVSHLPLSGLDVMGVVSCLESAIGQSVDDPDLQLVQDIHRETAGNPFLVTQFLRHLSETGAVFEDDAGIWTTRETLEEMVPPQSISQVMGARVARLGDGVTHVLSLAAVVGLTFDLDVLTPLTKMDEDELLDRLDEAKEAALLEELSERPGRYRFSNALVRGTLYHGLSATRRARAHAEVARTVESTMGLAEADDVDLVLQRLASIPNGVEHAQLLGHHWSKAATDGGRLKAIRYAMAAGDLTLGSGDPTGALVWFEMASQFRDQAQELGIPPDPQLLAGLQVGLANAREASRAAPGRKGAPTQPG